VPMTTTATTPTAAPIISPLLGPMLPTDCGVVLQLCGLVAPLNRKAERQIMETIPVRRNIAVPLFGPWTCRARSHCVARTDEEHSGIGGDEEVWADAAGKSIQVNRLMLLGNVGHALEP